MSFHNYRVLPVQKIPPSLWTDPLLCLPETLRLLYELELSHLSLLETAQKGTTAQGIFGGISEQETHDHFAHRFAVSAGRVEYCVLGPQGDFTGVSDALLTTFSEGEVALLDLPCGTGAASGALISTLIELRKEKVIPRLPLHIEIFAGDFAEPARKIFDSLLSRLQAPALEQGVSFSVKTIHWDATRSDSTSALMDEWFAQANIAVEWVVLITNFSGTLGNQASFDQFKPCLEHIVARLHNRQSTLIWAEPAASGKSKNLLRFLKDFVADRLLWFFRKTNAQNSPASASFDLRHPLKDTSFRSDVALERFDRK